MTKHVLRAQKPYLVIASPMCTAFSKWQALNRAKSTDHATMYKFYRKAVEHMNFVASLYTEQLEAGRYFVQEHPAGTLYSKLKVMDELQELPNVMRVDGDQC